ncbi:MAG TPA: bifunctional phosphopantothenoylcysteine decarboxylase/phosphopantothenate--cysteine ligase CoaBC [Solirubrobacteraceae bacterium]|jgi:phosphopantothenoylcysteine decarboxylase/phosphopantothenate--cysteine ligase
MARLLLGVSGGIAAYKALETARLAIKAGHAVRVIQTPASEQFVGRASFEAITGAPVLRTEFEPDPARGAYPGEPAPERAPISHLGLVDRAHAYLIAPASANTLAKLAHGHADNLLTTAALAAACPVAVAPAMNNRMYLHAATQANLAQLGARGVTVIPPGQGDLASHGEHGIGRLAEPAQLIEAVEALLTPATWSGVRVLVTAGGTREPLDSVRFLGNRSSGRMGYALAAQAARRGAQVAVIAANVALEPPAGVKLVEVETAAELAEACESSFPACDVLLMAAAVADFRPAARSEGKIKKDSGPPTLELEATADILSGLSGQRRPDQVVVGFAAEHGPGAVDYGRGKLERKGLDMVVVNDVSDAAIGFDARDNAVTILIAGGGERQVARASKKSVADVVLDEVEAMRLSREETGARAGAGARSAAGL